MITATTAVQTLRSAAGRIDPYPIYTDLHRIGPVSRLDRTAEVRYDVVVNGYDAVNELLREPSFRVADGELLDRAGSPWRDHPCLTALLTSMFFMNGPEHARLRRLFSHAFTPRRVNALRDPIIQIVDRLLDRLAARAADGGTVDYMVDFAFLVPGYVISELMGVPESDREWFLPRAQIFGEVLDLGVSSAETLRAGDQATVELTEYFAGLVAARRREPRDDLVSALAQGPDVDHVDLLANLLTFFNAGFVTTAHLLGNGLVVLLDRPEMLAGLTDRPEQAAGYVDEILRYDPPTHFVVRFAAQERELAGVTVPAGSPVLVLLGAANRDPHRFPEPDRFDPYRPDNRPLSFGAGLHYCLGAALSRLEGEIALPMLFDRFPKIAVSGEPVRQQRLTLRGYDNLLVTLD